MSTLTTQLPPPAIVPPVKAIVVAPGAGENEGDPQPESVTLGVAPTAIIAGKVSLNATPASASFWLGFEIVKLSVEVPPARIGLGANCFSIAGGTTAVSDAVATLVVVVPLSVVESTPLTFVFGPGVVATTSTLTVQDPDAGMVAPVVCPNASVVAPGAGAHDGEPEQDVVAEGVAATCTPAGSVSVNIAPVSGALFGFVSVKVRVETPFTATVCGENCLEIVGF